VVSGTRKFDCGLTQLLHADLHWLDVPQRINYKLCIMMRRCQDGIAVTFNGFRGLPSFTFIALVCTSYCTAILFICYYSLLHFTAFLIINHTLNLTRFWATVCKTVRLLRSVRCPSCLSVCLSCLSVTFVYCGERVGRIKMKLGLQLGLGPGHIVLDGDPAPLHQRGTAPNFRPMSVAAKWLHGSRCHLVRS